MTKMKAGRKIFECDGGAGAASPAVGGGEVAIGPTDSGAISSGGENSPIEAPGGCDHQEKGYMCPGCFHRPLPLFGAPYTRISRHKKKKRKDRKSKGYAYDNVRVIKSYDDLVAESENSRNWTYVLNVPSQHFEQMLRSSKIDNEKFNIEQFLKYIDENGLLVQDNSEIVGIFDNQTKMCLAAAVLKYDGLGLNDCYICELMTLMHGYGMKLLNCILDSTENTWLMSDVDSGEDLCDKFYRRNSKLSEIQIDTNHYCFDKNKPNTKVLHLFYAKSSANASNLKKAIYNQYYKKQK